MPIGLQVKESNLVKLYLRLWGGWLLANKAPTGYLQLVLKLLLRPINWQVPSRLESS